MVTLGWSRPLDGANSSRIPLALAVTPVWGVKAGVQSRRASFEQQGRRLCALVERRLDLGDHIARRLARGHHPMRCADGLQLREREAMM